MAVLRFSKSFDWRRVIGLIAAYALVLQSTLAVALVTAAAPADPAFSGTFFVICTADDGVAPGDAGAPVKHATHCPICILAASAGGLAAQVPVLAVPHEAIAVAAAFVSAPHGAFSHPPRAGLSRAPPPTV